MKPYLNAPRPAEAEQEVSPEPGETRASSHLPMLALTILVVGYIFFKLS